MKKNTIKWRIYKSNLVIIILLITLVTAIFNIAIRVYFENDILNQLKKIGTHTEDIALQKGADLFKGEETPPPDGPKGKENDFFHYYFMIDRSLRETLTVLNADYILLDQSKQVINPFPEDYFNTSGELLSAVTSKIDTSNGTTAALETYTNFTLNHTQYIAVIKPVSDKNTFGLGWIVIYCSLEKMNQLQWGINLILLCILIFSALIIALFSSNAARKISEPFSSLNQHITLLAERNFGRKLNIPVDDELQEFVSTINLMSEKLQTYDHAQKTFLQNASHEFRTPLMSIQSYAEGILYDVVDAKMASSVILEETKRMTHLVEDLLYLSRLEAIEEHDHLETINYHELILECLDRMEGISLKNSIKLEHHTTVPHDQILIADVEQLSRALVNILSNCIRYAKTTVTLYSELITLLPTTNCPSVKVLHLTITDDGPGFEESELPYVFERFFKGKEGQFGLGLPITKNIIEKHNGQIIALNGDVGSQFIIDLPI